MIVVQIRQNSPIYGNDVQEELEHESGRGTQHSEEVRDQISEELEFAISTWKQAINGDVTKDRAIMEGFGNENLSQLAGLSIPTD